MPNNTELLPDVAVMFAIARAEYSARHSEQAQRFDALYDLILSDKRLIALLNQT